MANKKLRALSGEQVSILKSTFRLMDTEGFAKRFYERLFQKYPAVRELFPSDMTEQSTKLISIFELLIFSLREHLPDKYYLQQEVLPPLRNLGRMHRERGIQDSHYPVANELILKSLREEPGFTFPPEALEAWKTALEHLTMAMLSNDNNWYQAPSGLYKIMHQVKSMFLRGVFKN